MDRQMDGLTNRIHKHFETMLKRAKKNGYGIICGGGITFIISPNAHNCDVAVLKLIQISLKI